MTRHTATDVEQAEAEAARLLKRAQKLHHQGKKNLAQTYERAAREFQSPNAIQPGVDTRAVYR